MKKIMIQLMPSILAILLFSATIPTQTSGQTVTRKFVNSRSEPIMLFIANDAEDGRQIIKDTVKINGDNGWRKIKVEVGDYVVAKMINDKYQKTDKIFINGTRSESEEIALYPQRSYLNFLSGLGLIGPKTKFLGNTFNYYGVDITKYSPRRVIDAFEPNKIFKGLGGESTPSETRSYYLQQSDLTVMANGFQFSGDKADQKGEMTTQAYFSRKSFKKAWNITLGVAGKSPKGVGGSVDFSYGEEFEKTENQSNVFYLKQQYNGEYCVSVNLAEAEFDYNFIKAVAEIKTPQDADNFVETYGTHYPVLVRYGGLFSQYTSVSKNDYYEANRKNLDIKVAVEASTTGNERKQIDKTPLQNIEETIPGKSKSASGSVGYSQNESRELRRILSNSKSRYTAIGGSITSGGDWVKDGKNTAIAMDLELITDLIDAKVLKSRYTAQDLKGIKQKVDAAVKRKIARLKDYAPEKPMRAYKMQIDQIRITKHKDDTWKDSKGFIKARVMGAEKGKPIEIDLYNVDKYGYPGINKDWEIHFSDDKEENKTTRTWHYFVQEANADGSFSPLTVDFQAKIWDKDGCCGDEVAEVKWGEKVTNPLVPNQVYPHVMKFIDKSILVLQDFEIEATILILPTDPLENPYPNRINRAASLPVKVKEPVIPFTPPTLAKEEFEKLARSKIHAHITLRDASSNFLTGGFLNPINIAAQLYVPVYTGAITLQPRKPVRFNNMFWQFKPTGDGYYHIIDVQYGLALVAGNKGGIFHKDPKGTPNAKWKLEPTGDGTFYITDKKYGKSLVKSSRGRLQHVKHKNQIGARWNLTVSSQKGIVPTEMESNEAYASIAIINQQGMAIEAINRSVITLPYSKKESNLWQFKPTEDGYYHIIDPKDNLAIVASGKSNAVVHEHPEGRDNAKWKVTRVGKSQYRITDKKWGTSLTYDVTMMHILYHGNGPKLTPGSFLFDTWNLVVVDVVNGTVPEEM